MTLGTKTGISFRIQHFLIVFSLLFLLFISVALFFVPYQLYTNLYISQAEDYCNNFLAQANIGVGSSLTGFNEKIQEIIDDPSIREILEHQTPDPSSQYNYQIAVSKYFQPQTMDDYYLQELDLYIKESGESLQYGAKATQLDNPFSGIYYQKAIAYPTKVNWLYYNPDMDCIELSAIAYSKDSYAVQGLFIIRLSTDFLLNKFNAYNTLDINQLYIADQNQQILCTTEGSALGLTLQDLHLDTNTGIIEMDSCIAIKRTLYSSNTSFPYDEWTSTILLDKQLLLQPFHKIAKVFYGIVLGLLLCSVFIIIKFSDFITKPVAALVFAMKRVEKEHLDIILPEDSPLKEINDIYHGFNKMVTRLNTLINSVYKSKLAHQEAQLKALQSQINPHFLFNTLQLISWKAYEYEAMPVCDMLGSLSYMLQTDLCSDDENIFTLREEVEYIRQYSKIIQCKYNDKIKILIDVPDELMECKIPKLILQPFLENSITHGLAPKTSPGKVSLSVMRKQDCLLVSIEDDGIGMRSNILHTIQKAAEHPNDIKGNTFGHHIALNNIQDRIHLLYGEAYGFTIESRLNTGTTVSLKLPCIMVQNN